jgi:restriction endonuclease in pPIWI_RE module
MSETGFAERCEAIFAPTHGRRWKSACAEALGISRATLYRYLDGASTVPADIEKMLASLTPPETVQVRSDSEMARLIAVAVVRLRTVLDAYGWLKPPYEPDIQRCLDLCAARNIAEGAERWPSSVAALIRVASLPLDAWMADTAAWDPYATFTAEPLLDGQQTTTTCRELAAEVEGHSPEDELIETRGFGDFRTACASQRDGQASYALWRRFVIEHPVNEGLGRVLVAMPELGNVVGVEQAFQTFYEPLPAAYAGEDGMVPICRVSGTVLRRGHGGVAYETESRDPEAVRLARAGECDRRRWSQNLRMLKRPFRSFWSLPGKSEVALMDRLVKLGWSMEPWPDLDRVDLVATSPDGARRVAADVKDFASATLLAARFDGFKGYERTHECYLVVPDARLAADRTYASVFANLRTSLGKKAVALRSVSRLATELGNGA